MPIKIIVTGDGSHSLLHEELQETYHSVHGAVRESRHVFIDAGLAHFVKRSGKSAVSIFEVGFGTGLNAWLAQEYAHVHQINIHYTSIELFPLPEDIWSSLNYVSSEEDIRKFSKLHEAAWDTTVRMDDRFSLCKLTGSLEEKSLTGMRSDVVFFDAFAPSKQPDMWALPILAKCVSLLPKAGVLVTYCARGQVKRDLKSLGLITETLPGPPGKKEMVRGTKEA